MARRLDERDKVHLPGAQMGLRIPNGHEKVVPPSINRFHSNSDSPCEGSHLADLCKNRDDQQEREELIGEGTVIMISVGGWERSMANGDGGII